MKNTFYLWFSYTFLIEDFNILYTLKGEEKYICNQNTPTLFY